MYMQLLSTNHISADLAHCGIFRAYPGKFGVMISKRNGFKQTQ